ncbi:MAG: methionine gamma-lyase family protein [Clostridia bacterium]
MEEIIKQARSLVEPIFEELAKISRINHGKVIESFRALQVSDECFRGSTGYGYDYYGRDLLDALYAQIFGAEDALVRPHIVSGTQAISIALYAVLRPGDELISITGSPYDTLLNVIGNKAQDTGSLINFGITYKEIKLNESQKPDLPQIKKTISQKTKAVLIQRSRGYAWREALTIEEISKLIATVKEINPNIICLVDNCYGEFVEEKEPTQVGADLIAGSLIKNPGGGLAPTGGYIAGKKALIKLVAQRLTAPGIGREVGSYPGETYRLIYQGIYLAPMIVNQALRGAIYTAAIFSLLGYDVSPSWDAKRSDIIQAIKLGKPEKIIDFCKCIQEFSPIDSNSTPMPWDMPGYNDQVIMAGGTFIQGSTMELSADAPMREPYAIYLQGGLSFTYTELVINNAAKSIGYNTL